MLRLGACLALCALVASSLVVAQSGTRSTRKPVPKPAPTVAPADVTCPEQLGTGVRTRANFCFVLAGRNPADGVLVAVPPHTEATLTFDLHNRHSYSEEEVRAGRGFAKYTAVIGVLTMTGDLLGRGAVQSEFRQARDLYDRITGGAGPAGMKAVAPLGREQVTISIPPSVAQVSLLGEVLEASTSAGREIATPGRPVAIVSNLQLQYIPAPPPRKR
jgi:hypothetical protein